MSWNHEQCPGDQECVCGYPYDDLLRRMLPGSAEWQCVGAIALKHRRQIESAVTCLKRVNKILGDALGMIGDLQRRIEKLEVRPVHYRDYGGLE